MARRIKLDQPDVHGVSRISVSLASRVDQSRRKYGAKVDELITLDARRTNGEDRHKRVLELTESLITGPKR